MNKSQLDKQRYGLVFDEPSEKDDIFLGRGSISKNPINPLGDWTDFLVKKEFQNLNGIEPYACVSFTILNCVETLIKFQYGIEENFSDRFLAAISGTKIGGNSPRKVADALRHKGVPFEGDYPFNVNSFEKYYGEIPQEIIDLAKDFNSRYEFRYEIVPSKPAHITQALKCSPLLISVYAWVKEGDYYVRPEGFRDIHATTLFKQEPEKYRRVFDSYDNPHIKDLRWSDMPMMVRRFYIKKRDKPLTFKRFSWLDWFNILKTYKIGKYANK